MTTTDWAGALQHALVVGAVFLGLRGLAKGRMKPTPRQGALTYPLAVLVCGVATSSLFFGLLIASLTFARNDTTTWWSSLILLGFGAMGLALVGEYYRSRHQLTATGLSYGKLLGSRNTLEWSNVTKVEFSAVNKWFVLSTRDGKRVRLSTMLQGLPGFADAVLVAAPQADMTPCVRELLEQTRRGDLPRLY